MISDSLLKEISDYIALNDLKIELDNFIDKLIRLGFNIEKYGFKPNENIKKEEVKIIEKEIEKVVYVSNDEDIKMLKSLNDDLSKELTTVKLELQKKDKEFVEVNEKYHKIVKLIEDNSLNDDFYGEDDGIIKKLKNEIKRK